jgi:hypothetical protein
MLTSYWVRCPHDGCHWSGSLLPRDAEAGRGPSPPHAEVVFQCPNCQGEWHARIVHDEVEPLPVAEMALSG